MLIGTLGAINQKKIKRLFAYSSIAHVGYLLIGLATGTIEAVESLLVYIVVYVLMIINVFGIILSMSKENYHSFDLMTSWWGGPFGATPAVSTPRGALSFGGAPLPSASGTQHGQSRGFVAPAQPTDSANPAYSAGPNASFVYMLRTEQLSAGVCEAQDHTSKFKTPS